MLISIATVMLISACATRHPAAPVAVDSSAQQPNMDTGLSTAAQTTPIPNEPIVAGRDLSGNPDPNSYAYREDAKQLATELAQSQDLDPKWVWAALSKAKVKDSVAKLMMPAPSGTAKNWALYRSRFVEPIRIRAGVAFWRDHESELKRAEKTYGVPANIIAGILGVETIYGRQTGTFRVLDVLTTLSLDFPKGRSDRSSFFKNELGQFLKLCQERQITPDSMLGSYAGAVGLPQFMPSSIRRFGVDFDGDGQIDLINSPSDAIGSVAHYLAEHGWQAAWPSYFDITPPNNEAALATLLTPDIVPSFSAMAMQDLGASLSEAGQKHPGQLALIQLENGNNAPTLVAGTSNFYAITRYNQSSYYALAVVQLGEAVAREVTRQSNKNP